MQPGTYMERRTVRGVLFVGVSVLAAECAGPGGYAGTGSLSVSVCVRAHDSAPIPVGVNPGSGTDVGQGFVAYEVE